MQKTADERANAVDSKLAEIGTQFAELRVVVERSSKQSIEETGLTIDRVRDEILGALIEDTAGLIAALALNENVAVWLTDVSRYLLFIY